MTKLEKLKEKRDAAEKSYQKYKKMVLELDRKISEEEMKELKVQMSEAHLSFDDMLDYLKMRKSEVNTAVNAAVKEERTDSVFTYESK